MPLFWFSSKLLKCQMFDVFMLIETSFYQGVGEVLCFPHCTLKLLLSFVTVHTLHGARVWPQLRIIFKTPFSPPGGHKWCFFNISVSLFVQFKCFHCFMITFIASPTRRPARLYQRKRKKKPFIAFFSSPAAVLRFSRSLAFFQIVFLPTWGR